MRWIMDVLQHARYKQPSCGVSLSGFLSEARGPMKEKTQSSSSHLDYLPSPVPSPETSRKLNSGKDGAVPGARLLLGGLRDCPCPAIKSGCARGVAGAGAGRMGRAAGLSRCRTHSACAVASAVQVCDKGLNVRGFFGFHLSEGHPHSGRAPLCFSHLLQTRTGCQMRKAPQRCSWPPTVTTTPARHRARRSLTWCTPPWAPSAAAGGRPPPCGTVPRMSCRATSSRPHRQCHHCPRSCGHRLHSMTVILSCPAGRLSCCASRRSDRRTVSAPAAWISPSPTAPPLESPAPAPWTAPRPSAGPWATAASSG